MHCVSTGDGGQEEPLQGWRGGRGAEGCPPRVCSPGGAGCAVDCDAQQPPTVPRKCPAGVHTAPGPAAPPRAHLHPLHHIQRAPGVAAVGGGDDQGEGRQDGGRIPDLQRMHGWMDGCGRGQAGAGATGTCPGRRRQAWQQCEGRRLPPLALLAGSPGGPAGRRRCWRRSAGAGSCAGGGGRRRVSERTASTACAAGRRASRGCTPVLPAGRPLARARLTRRAPPAGCAGRSAGTRPGAGAGRPAPPRPSPPPPCSTVAAACGR